MRFSGASETDLNKHPGLQPGMLRLRPSQLQEHVMKEDRIHLKSPEWDDMRFIRQLWSDPETMQPVGGPIHLTDDQARRWFAEKIDSGGSTNCYRLILDHDDQSVGEISHHHLDAESMTASFNIKIMHGERGKGYAKEAMQILLDEFFDQRGGRVMMDDVALENLAGQEALIRFGFEHDSNADEVFRLRMTRERFNSLREQTLEAVLNVTRSNF